MKSEDFRIAVGFLMAGGCLLGGFGMSLGAIPIKAAILVSDFWITGVSLPACAENRGVKTETARMKLEILVSIMVNIANVIMYSKHEMVRFDT